MNGQDEQPDGIEHVGTMLAVGHHQKSVVAHEEQVARSILTYD
jgi:hypothetical protein